jgi:hypothetical protein
LTEKKKANHRTNIVRVGEPRIHGNADTLELLDIGGYQVVVKKGEFKQGDLAVYFQPDSVVPQTEPFRFIWENYEDLDGIVPIKKRRITVRKFRGEWSEGLLLLVNDFKPVGWPGEADWFSEGQDVSDVLGVTHYEPEEKGMSGPKPQHKKRLPKTLKGWIRYLFYNVIRLVGLGRAFGLSQSTAMEVDFEAPVYDVEALKCFRTHFEEGELVCVTEKLHGSNARYVYLDGTMYAGSHYQWKNPNSSDQFNQALKQNPWIEEWCRGHEGFILYGEVVGKQKNFHYGCKDGEVKFFAFDIRTPYGTWEKPYMAFHKTVPVLYIGPFNLETIKTLVDGPSKVPGANHIREGIVVNTMVERSVRGVGRLNLKIVSNSYLEKDSK